MSAAAQFEPFELAQDAKPDLAVMLTGGGARAAYQVGLIKGIARHFPALRFEIIVGVSAGAINAAYLAAFRGTLAEKADRLARMWCELNCDSIYRFDWKAFLPLLMFEPEYTMRLIELGESDVDARLPELHAFLETESTRLAAV